ncbi:MAG: response regulator transcription factor [Actinomycetota bacterium]
MRVLVVDDHSGFRRALVATLNLVSDVEVVAEAADGDAAYEAALSQGPDVVLMDLSMPGVSGTEAMRRIHRKRPDLPVIILTAHADPALEREARGAGARGFIAKGGGLQELVDAITEVARVEADEATNGA